jgi:putative selenate reductase
MPFGVLVRQMLHEYAAHGTIFGLPKRKFVLAVPGKDLSVAVHGQVAATPFGPAAGPHTQMAQNLVLAWLTGSRILELKTVQILDRLQIPRPCIDIQTVGYNIEWSQELSLRESLDEYVKAWMLIHILRHTDELGIAADFGATLFDLSVGYDLEGIQSARVQAFLQGAVDASARIDHFRRRIPSEFRHLRDLDYPTQLSDTLTVSTFHGCPPKEIEAIAAHLLERNRLHTVVKLNPTLLGADGVDELLHDALGYREIEVPEHAYRDDPTWEQALLICGRLAERAADCGRGFGVKFSNTLLVKNHRAFFSAEHKEMYLSGPPLHLLAMHLVRRFRRAMGDAIPISFSAGVDRHNFAETVALGLLPVTVCTDMLKPGGYGRAQSYFTALATAMERVGADTLDHYTLQAMGQADTALERVVADDELRRRYLQALAAGRPPQEFAERDLLRRWVAAARVLNTESYIAALATDPHYARERNSKPPKKIGSALELFDCVTCDKCIPVCPNAGNFAFDLPATEIPRILAHPTATGGWRLVEQGVLRIEAKHQIGNYADFCNECGNCDVFCPEDGGPYAIKPRFFRLLRDWRCDRSRHGFHLQRLASGGHRVHGRFPGGEYSLDLEAGRASFHAGESVLRFDPENLAATLHSDAPGREPVDLTYARIMELLLQWVARVGAANFVAASLAFTPPAHQRAGGPEK